MKQQNYKNILITGGAGYVGSVLTPQLLDADYNVTVYDIMYFGADGLPQHPNLSVIEGDSRDTAKLEALEKQCLAENERFRDWHCTEKLMSVTRGGKALYMHCLPADITGVSCEAGEVEASVFERYRLRTYRQASHKPFVIAAMILLTRCREPGAVLKKLFDKAGPRAPG